MVRQAGTSSLVTRHSLLHSRLPLPTFASGLDRTYFYHTPRTCRPEISAQRGRSRSTMFSECESLPSSAESAYQLPASIERLA